MDGQNKWKGHLKKCLLISGVFLLVSGIGFAFYVSDYYRSDPVAIETLEQENVEVLGDFTVILPEKPGNSAVIFYPGGKVEHSAYLPLLEEISQHGITCILAKMPFNLAVFDIYKADGILGTMPEIEYWFLAGHSLGGIMASVAAEHNTLVHGLILLGSYLYSDFPVEKTLTIHGSLEESIAQSIQYTENIRVIPGGNHAQFGNYGKQKGDPDAEISWEEQQAQTVEFILEFMESLS